MADAKEKLKDRVLKFQMLELPGQPMMMHMGTSYLVQDLWREVQSLRAALSMTRSGTDTDEAMRSQNCEI
ncbi:hypothetical protein OEG84_24955 [Hoeflea sp. G2-23]|uniref:Uncharacterized protein n=1 Tax=Hoeflea algicola TaxID=2983763 RepID=A0ABT3Z311_9HYPH|nr:hypothetical protein [Hoeflea algicola]MCY0146158.1 hypothetical protein [Hoeflea algicola]MCY0150857.1 hypothetical protein [Hoeflea algicola]